MGDTFHEVAREVQESTTLIDLNQLVISKTRLLSHNRSGLFR